MMRSIYNKIVFPYVINNYYKHNVNAIYNKLLVTQYMNLKEINLKQEILLNKLLQFVSRSNKFYSDRFSIHPIRLNDLKKFKMLTKKEIVDKYNSIYKKYSSIEYEHETSGSTGQPLKIISSNISEAHRMAQRLRFYQWWGIKPSDASVLLWGGIDNDVTNRSNTKEKLKRYFKGKNLKIDAASLNMNTIKDYYNEMLMIKPSYIRGYRSAIYLFAYLLDKCGLRGSRLGLKVAITTSEILDDEQRDYIEEILNVKVADEYGAAEIGLIAYECPSGSKHICEELVYVYANNNNEMIVTDLHNYSMPLINYMVGDKILIENRPCICGRKSRTIVRVEGRSHDYILLENGEYMCDSIFYYAIKDLGINGFANSILQYKVIQDQLCFIFFIVKGENFQEGVEAYLRGRIQKTIGKNILIKFRYVDKIPLDKSGKLRFFERIS
jgi:phenylacetate-CoA ligase